MKKKMIIIACCLLLAGMGFVGIGILSGGTLNFYYALGSKVNTDSQLQYDMQTEKVESFDSIDVKLDGFGDCQLELIEGDGYSVTYPKENEYVTGGYKIENGVLKLETKKKHRLVFFQIDFLNHKSEKQFMQITVPKGTKLSSLKVNSEIGDVVNALNADEVIFDLEYGNVEIAGCESRSMQITNESGDVSISEIDCDDCSCEVSYGKVTITDSSLGKLIVKDESGNVKIENTDLVDGNFTLSYGKLNMEDSNMQTAKFNLESGDAGFDNVTLGQAELKMSFGSLTAKGLTVETLTGGLESGNASLFLTGTKEDYSMKLMVESGDIKVGEEKATRGSYQYDAPNTVSKIELENEFGDIRVEFEK